MYSVQMLAALAIEHDDPLLKCNIKISVHYGALAKQAEFVFEKEEKSKHILFSKKKRKFKHRGLARFVPNPNCSFGLGQAWASSDRSCELN